MEKNEREMLEGKLTVVWDVGKARTTSLGISGGLEGVTKRGRVLMVAMMTTEDLFWLRKTVDKAIEFHARQA